MFPLNVINLGRGGGRREAIDFILEFQRKEKREQCASCRWRNQRINRQTVHRVLGHDAEGTLTIDRNQAASVPNFKRGANTKDNHAQVVRDELLRGGAEHVNSPQPGLQSKKDLTINLKIFQQYYFNDYIQSLFGESSEWF